ncbi:MAG: histidine phosphatase family protein [Acidimicrobiia bacterium]|nr:histidine phosphatase family protein [Acidimicrobiia bacterium]
MARLLLVRHAPTPETGVKLTGRLPGISLGAEGERVAGAAAERLAGVKLGAVYTSPITRTAETAAIIAARHGLTPLVEDGIQEVDFGMWQGRTLNQLRRLKLWRQVQLTPSQVRFPGGESFPEMQTRAVDACNRLGTGKKTIVLVSHSDVIKAILAHYLGQPLDLFQRIIVQPASISIVHLNPGGFPMVETINSFAPVQR